MAETKATYQIVETSLGEVIVQRLEIDGSVTSIPADPANSDYIAYLESLNDNTEAE